jgi:hypothetical protein
VTLVQTVAVASNFINPLFQLGELEEGPHLTHPLLVAGVVTEALVVEVEVEEPGVLLGAVVLGVMVVQG